MATMVRLRPRAAVLALALVATAGGVVFAATAAIDGAATVGRPAERLVEPVGDLAVAFDVGALDRFTHEATVAAALRAGAVAAPSRSLSLGLRRLARNGATVHAPPAGYLIPMAVISMPREAVGGVLGSDVSAILGPSSVVMNEMTAGLMGAAVGDVVELRTAAGGTLGLTVAGIRPYSQLGWAELAFTTDVANRLGMHEDTRVVIWDIDDREALDRELAAGGVLGRADTKVVRSWDPVDPDDTISTARTKVALGEPWYRIESDGSLTMHPDWIASNLTAGRVLLDPTIRIRAQCHVRIVSDLSAALAEVAASGLAWAIDVGNANTYGGCYAPRYSRTSGFLSRHTYGMALDTNTSSNCLGCTPRMDCRVVRIFRKHGFAWGGNFRQPDGMHFEWVGEPLHQIQFPSRYCPNLPGGAIQSIATTSVGMDVLTAGPDEIEHDHPHDP